MDILAIIVILMTLYFIIFFFIKKDYFNALTYIFFGVTVPLGFYLLDFSNLIIKEKSIYFNYTFICFFAILSCYVYFTKSFKLRPLVDKEIITITKFGKQMIFLTNVFFVICLFLENYFGSGTFFPALNSIDIHTFTLPIISYFTNTPFLPVVLNYYAFKATKKKCYLLLIFLILLLPVISKSTRLFVVITLLEFLSLILFYEKSYKSDNLKDFRKKLRSYKRLRIVLFLLGIICLFGLIEITTMRMNQFGKYNMAYSEIIGYTGPEWSEFLAPYYGYFPLSFNNLNMNMLYRKIEHNYLGLYSFTCLYFGLLQLDNILGINAYEHLLGRHITSSASTVPTGFWEYYYDFGFLCFIPIIVAFFICCIFLIKGSKEKKRLTYRTLYFWFVPLWFFMGFQNLIFGPSILVMGIILWFVVKNGFIVKQLD